MSKFFHRNALPAGSGRQVLAGALLIATLAACSSGGGTTSTGGAGRYGFAQASQDSAAPITVWVDADRAAAAEAFKKANPAVALTVVTYDGSANGSNSFKTKIGLLDRAGQGWPDVVFSTQNNDAAWASQKTNGKQAFAATLDQGLIPQDVLAGFTKGALDPCTVSGHVYCLRNDLAQNVLWFNKTLLDKFKYTLPKTWEEYQTLSAKVAQEHPGYITGGVGDAWTPEVFMWASECAANQVTGPRAVTVDATGPNCERAAKVIDAGVANKTLATLSVFSPGFAKQYSDKVLMMPGPAWFAGAVFNNPSALKLPAGQLGVAAPLSWGGAQPVTGDVGGGTWFISSHSKNLAAATKFAQFVTTADDYQVELAPGYPASAAAGAKWIAKQETSKYYATSLQPIIEAGGQIWSGWGSPEFSQEAIWAKTMTPLVNSGQSVAANLQKWQDAIKDQAQVTGYTVK
jgi:multiple sugar transport system substrate-binding protein